MSSVSNNDDPPPPDFPDRVPTTALIRPPKSALKNKSVSYEVRVGEAAQFLKQLATEPFCRRRTCRGKDRHRKMDCSCLHTLLAPINHTVNPRVHSAARFVVSFFNMPFGDRQRKLVQMMQQAAAVATELKQDDFDVVDLRVSECYRHYSLPQSADVARAVVDNGDDNPRICTSAFMALFGLSNDTFRALKKNAINNTLPSHGLTGKSANRANPEVMKSLKHFFLELSYSAYPKGNMLELPPAQYNSRRQVYKLWCWECGYHVTFDKVGKIKTCEPRPHDPETWPVGSVPQTTCSWTAFLRFWKRDYPKLTISSAAPRQHNVKVPAAVAAAPVPQQPLSVADKAFCAEYSQGSHLDQDCIMSVVRALRDYERRNDASTTGRI